MHQYAHTNMYVYIYLYTCVYYTVVLIGSK